MKAKQFLLTAAIAATMAAGVTPLVAHAGAWTLQECVDYAVLHNIQVNIQRQQVAAGELSVDEARNSFLPQVGASASQSFNFGRGLTAANTYADRNTSSFSWSASLQVPLFSGLRNSRVLEQSKLNLRQLACSLDESIDNVTLQIISQYLQVLYNREVENTARDQVSLSQFELERRRNLAANGKIAEVEVLEADAQLAKDSLTLITAGNDTRLALLELSQMLQLDAGDSATFDVVAIDGDDPLLPPAMDVYTSALGNNPGLKSAEWGVKAAEAGIKVAQTGYIPTLSLSGGLGSSYYNLHGSDNLPFKTQMRENYSTYVGFSLNIPIFDALNTRTQVKRARVNLVQARLQADDTRTRLYSAIQQAYCQAQGAEMRSQSARRATAASEASFAAMAEKFNLGRATSTEYEQSKTNLFNARIQQLQARFEYLLRYRILKYYQDRQL